MHQLGIFDLSDRYTQLSEHGDPLEKLDAIIDWKIFSKHLKKSKQKKNNAGRPPFDSLLMFKILILQSLYHLSDAQTEYQIRDRLSFMRFLGLGLNSRVADEKTIWLFREQLTKTGRIRKLFLKFDRYLTEKGFHAKMGQIVDATIIPAPRQRNSRDENKQIKEGETPKEWEQQPSKLSQKDVNARWTKKRGETYYGYKDHISVDTEHKLIRKYVVTPANTPDIQCMKELLDEKNTGKYVWGDKAYRGKKVEEMLSGKFIDKINFRSTAAKWMPDEIRRENVRRSKIRVRVEHVFGFMVNTMKGKMIRCIGMKRTEGKIGLMNLVYNLCRYEQLNRHSATSPG